MEDTLEINMKKDIKSRRRDPSGAPECTTCFSGVRVARFDLIDLLWLTPLSAIFQLYQGDQF